MNEIVIASIDDHIVEPPEMFRRHLPSDAPQPRVVEARTNELWLSDDLVAVNIGLNAVVGRPKDEWGMAPARFEQLRRTATRARRSRSCRRRARRRRRHRTADDRWLSIVCLQADRYWKELCAQLGRDDLATDDRFVDIPTRAVNSAACVTELDRTFATRTLADWRSVLSSFTGVWAPVNTPAELHQDEQVDANGFLPHNTTLDGAPYRLPAPPQQFGHEPGAPSAPAPALGQHTEEVLLELGKDWHEITALRASGALG